jgi:hypothetical protein
MPASHVVFVVHFRISTNHRVRLRLVLLMLRKTQAGAIDAAFSTLSNNCCAASFHNQPTDSP